MVHTRSVRVGNSSLPHGQGQPPNNLPPLIPPQLTPQLPPQVPTMFPHVDHAEGGDENQPHTSAHNSTSTANQDVVAAQLAAMQQQFEKLVAEHRGAPPSHHAADSIPHPLNTNITLEPYPAGFKIPQLETYDRTKDPDDHLHAFYSCLQAQNASDMLMCKIFPSTLRGNARTWYYSLHPRPISSYTEMTSAFATKFSSRRLIRKTTSELMRVKQRDGESLENYMSRFNDAVLEVSSFDQVVGIAAVISGLKHERFRDSLIKHAAITFSEVNNRSLKFITAEEYALAQNPTPSKNQNPEWRDDNLSRKRMRMAQNRGPMPTYTPRFGRPNSTPPQQSTEQGPQPQGTRNPSNRQGVGYQQNPPPFPPPARIIHMITGGLEAGGLSSKQRKLYVRKFPTPMGIATLRGNQEVARHCYITSVTQPTKGKDQTPEAVPQRIPDNQQVMGVEIVDNRPEDETRAASVEDVEEVLIDDRDPSRKTQIGTRLNPEVRAELIAFLRANNDVFAWTSIDMPEIPNLVSQHKLSANPLKKPVAQKRRLFGGERLQAIKEEVEKLLQAGFVRKVDYCEWLANSVLVKKANVEAASGNERLSLLDAYSGYHQVPMALEDEEKTSFYAGDEIYCYVMMPFGLKNAGATYQKMVTIVFRAQIGRNLEVYVDDIVVKSLKAENHLADLDETFNNLKKNKMRLNPAKCIFGVGSGKFLGFMVSRRGIEVNPEKIRAIAEMEPSKSVKDIQRLTGRVAALHRFILNSVDKCLPFFKIMRSAAQKEELGKQKKFEWNEAISSVLVREETKQQKPIYYISSVQHGAELRYPIAEKAALAVVTSARRSAIRAQALIDFIVECTPCPSTPNPEPNDWTLYVDGASISKGSGVGAILIGPEGYRSEHALKFKFDATNNIAEYEALLLGLQLALEFKISAIQVYSDSQLVVNQINSICEVVDPMMVKYVALVAELKCKFQKFCLSKTPRPENEQVDSLSKFASDSSLSSRSVFVEVLDEPSFMKPRMMEISTNPDTPSWTNSITSFLRDEIVPEDRQEAMKLSKKASRYTLVDGVLYKRSFSLPLLRCLNPYEAEYALREVHEGVCESHVGARTLAHKVLRQGYYWPNMHKDATYFVQKCPKCQFFAHLTHQPTEELTNLVALWPFAQWGLDLLGPFLKGVSGVTHLVVGVDYFTKWVEAWPLSSLTSKKVEDFVFSSIIRRYWIPNQIVADNGTQFNCSSFRDFCSSYGIKLQFTSVYHLESNGMVESINKCILEGIKSRLEQHKAKWADELNNVLWAYRTTSRTATGEKPYHLAFDTEAVIPVEIGVPSFRVTHFDEGRNGQLLRENLDLLAEVRE
ncbi:hypothetical protein SLEP1_g28683 [Rubroshorea leprosula]|uniref:Uncharacterized protein n=1 Tax=Rubroshorea leprosula TaxID=152421 RepID=A0AAV5JUE9_9ROSI|nr:hypothetical protein SLEP1_g28683 [Rubroshorea leprosula]